MLSAGLVTVASAAQYSCTWGDTNKCCIDQAYVQNKINKSKGAGVPISGGYNIVIIDSDLTDDGSDGICLSQSYAIASDNSGVSGDAKWSPNNWDGSAVFVPSSSANKDNAIIHANNPDARIITNN